MTTPLKRKKRFLTTRTIPDEPITPPLTRKKRRQLNAPLVSLDTLNLTSPSSSPPPSARIGSNKRSLRAASEAIAKREKERQTSTTKMIKRKRKLHSQKVVLPASDDLTETGDVSYSAYLDNQPSLPVQTPVTQPTDPKPAIVVGIPTKRRKLITTPTVPSTVTSATTTTTTTIHNNILDLSQHSILPNSSYIGHLPSQKSLFSDQESSSNEEGSIGQSYPDEVQDHLSYQEEKVLFESTVSLKQQTEEATLFDTSLPMTQEKEAIVDSQEITLEPCLDTVDTLLENSDSMMQVDDEEEFSSTGPIFFDAINDFEDMAISEEQREKILGYEPSTPKEQPQQKEQKSTGFWSMFFRPFSSQ
ncbi:hypothetical protein A0J61_03019 [Choanephora cucurbitarum]|uniref:Uncharacterized protein n=1 Tax=Choanephora cucurbitarum TaxID=101091 RepID=A0A1C7NIH4_9FUNG|nr:hypothetical protein A0J61_03019 [Choanephora cucurbitarum]